ncbi:MAG: BTAD domain-containing putative transcriptional regulator [Eubacteriales bacterium]
MEYAPKLNIRMLGEFSLSYGDKVILDQHSRSGKVWSLLEYLVTFREKEVSQTEIIELLWSDDDEISDPSNTLKTLLHRVRALLGQLDKDVLPKTITYRRGAYRWVPTVPCTIDVEEFDHLCQFAATSQDNQEALPILLQAIELYKGDFLPGASMESWVIPINAYYRNQYMKIVYRVLQILNTQGQFDKMLPICQKAVTVDPYDEGLHTILIKTLLATGSQRAALQHYKYVTDLFFTQFGVSPSDDLTALYKEVVKTDKNTELDLSIIKEGLEERPLTRSAFFCEYQTFKDVYHLEARTILRTGYAIHVALITVTADSRTPLTQKQLNTTMERLQDVIGLALRQNDIFTRYSLTQYLVMLPHANYENSQMVLNRVATAFRSQYPKMSVILQYKILPLDPLSLAP